MYQTGKNKTKSAFSLIEILVSLAIFSVIISTVLGITVAMISAQKKIQAKLFLTQTAQTTLESMSRQIRYGYSYSGSTQINFDSSEGAQTIKLETQNLSTASGTSASSSAILFNAKNSPFILFETQSGNPSSYADQSAFCAYNGQLYRVFSFLVETNGTTYKARCSDGAPMLPENIILEKISFDIYAGDVNNPRNPTVRIKMKIKHEDTGSMEIQTSISQRVISYF